MILNRFIIPKKYFIGQTGQAGIVFYDKGYYIDNWRYMECASSNQTSAQWGGRGILIGGTSSYIGHGINNTIVINNFWAAWRTARILVANGGTWDGNPIDNVDYTGVQTQLIAGKIPSRYKWDGSAANNDPTTWTWIATWAAKVCSELTLNNKSDWALPSLNELNLMYQNLKVNGIGGFASSWYLCSTENTTVSVWIQNFLNGFTDGTNKNSATCVRAVRAF